MKILHLKGISNKSPMYAIGQIVADNCGTIYALPSDMAEIERQHCCEPIRQNNELKDI